MGRQPVLRAPDAPHAQRPGRVDPRIQVGVGAVHVGKDPFQRIHRRLQHPHPDRSDLFGHQPRGEADVGDRFAGVGQDLAGAAQPGLKVIGPRHLEAAVHVAPVGDQDDLGIGIDDVVVGTGVGTKSIVPVIKRDRRALCPRHSRGQLAFQPFQPGLHVFQLLAHPLKFDPCGGIDGGRPKAALDRLATAGQQVGHAHPDHRCQDQRHRNDDRRYQSHRRIRPFSLRPRRKVRERDEVKQVCRHRTTHHFEHRCAGGIHPPVDISRRVFPLIAPKNSVRTPVSMPMAKSLSDRRHYATFGAILPYFFSFVHRRVRS